MAEVGNFDLQTHAMLYSTYLQYSKHITTRGDNQRGLILMHLMGGKNQWVGDVH